MNRNRDRNRKKNILDEPYGFLVISVPVLVLLVTALVFVMNSGSSEPDYGYHPEVSNPVSETEVSETEIEEESGTNTVPVTIPNGLTVMQTAKILEQAGLCNAQEFYASVNSVDFSSEFDFLPSFDTLKSKGRPYLLEGYLFPGTYAFEEDGLSDDIIRMMLKRFGDNITAETRSGAAAVGEAYGTALDFDGALILASIVEREMYINPSEMPGVAAVFLNRIKMPGGTVEGSGTGGKFQSDMTKYYPYGYKETPEGFSSEYNTYNFAGLPKGPICNPSPEAIKAALNPDKNNGAFFFYFDINAKVYYAVTFQEHQANYQYCVDNGLAPQ